jgi:hypothetical protein
MRLHFDQTLLCSHNFYKISKSHQILMKNFISARAQKGIPLASSAWKNAFKIKGPIQWDISCAGRQCGVRKGAISTERARTYGSLTPVRIRICTCVCLCAPMLDYSVQPQSALTHKHRDPEQLDTERQSPGLYVYGRAEGSSLNLLRAKLVQIMKVRLLTSTGAHTGRESTPQSAMYEMMLRKSKHVTIKSSCLD